MKIDWFYKLLPHLPKPPQELVERIDMVYRPNIDLFKPNDTDHLAINQTDDWKDQEYNWIKPMASNTNVRYRFNEEYTQWIKNNIIDTFEENNSGVMFFDQAQLPHTDTTREYVLLYNIETGGPNAKLCFYQETGYPVLRNRGIAVARDKLILLDSIAGPKDCWYALNTQVIHGIEEATERRVNLQISFRKEIPTQFIKKDNI